MSFSLLFTKKKGTCFLHRNVLPKGIIKVTLQLNSTKTEDKSGASQRLALSLFLSENKNYA